MANGRDDLRLAVGWVDHIKTRRLVRACGADAAMCLLRLWSYAAVNLPTTGKFGAVGDVEDIGEWRGAPGALHAALVEIGWIDEDGISLHDWKLEQPWLVGKVVRSRAARGNAKRRWDARRNAESMPTASGPHNVADANGNAPSPSPSPSPSPLPSPLESEKNLVASDGDGFALSPEHPKEPDPIQAAFERWNVVAAEHRLPRADRLTTARASKLRARMREGATVETLEAAWRLMAVDPFLSGQNPGGKVYADLDYGCSGKATKWLEMARNGHAAQPFRSIFNRRAEA